MGVDCRLYLPPNVRVVDVASVLAKLCGAVSYLAPLGRNAVVARVTGAEVHAIADVPQCARVLVRCDGTRDIRGGAHSFLYHFEGRGGRRSIALRSYAPSIALLCRLVDFFGGSVDFSDHDAEDADYVRPDEPDSRNHASDGEEWDVLQRRIHAAPPLTLAPTSEYVRRLDVLAAYKLAEWPWPESGFVS